MTDEDAEGVGGRSLEDGGLQDHIAHWVAVLDGWVKRVDQGMGRQDAEVAGSNSNGAVGGTRHLPDEPGAESVPGNRE